MSLQHLYHNLWITNLLFHLSKQTDDKTQPYTTILAGSDIY